MAQNLDARQDDLRRLMHDPTVRTCRLVQFVGVEMVGARNVPVEEIESQVRGLKMEAFCVDWTRRSDCVYLRVWEFDGPEPPWSNVFAEAHLADVARILRDAKEQA